MLSREVISWGEEFFNLSKIPGSNDVNLPSMSLKAHNYAYSTTQSLLLKLISNFLHKYLFTLVTYMLLLTVVLCFLFDLFFICGTAVLFFTRYCFYVSRALSKLLELHHSLLTRLFFPSPRHKYCKTTHVLDYTILTLIKVHKWRRTINETEAEIMQSRSYLMLAGKGKTQN